MLGRHNHATTLQHYGAVLDQAQQLLPRLRGTQPPAGRDTPQPNLDRARAGAREQLRSRAELAASEPAYRALDPAAAGALGAPAAAPAGGSPADPGAELADCARRLERAAAQLGELCALIQARLEGLEPQAPPPPAPHDTDPDARLPRPGAVRRAPVGPADE